MTALASQLTELAAGHMLDRYELICPVAQGGMASVWLARMRGKHGFEKLVALKTILPSFAADARFRRMLLDEARIASRIEHVNVAQTLDLGEQDGHLYLVMEWVDGDSLSKLDRALERASLPMPVPILLRVVVEACAGLHAAHELCDEHGARLGVVHRDVSPQNILVSVKGQTKLIDFGIAKAQAAPSEETRAGILKGKLHYMPPEQALRKPVDRRADVWAVGAVLYRLLTRRSPYESPSPVTSLKLLTSLAPPPPLPSHIEESLAALVMRTLSPQPSERPATAQDLQTALERAAQASGGLATNQALASFVSEHLGDALQDRRDRIGTALRSAADVATAVGSSSRSAAGSANSGAPRPARPSTLATKLERKARAAAPEVPTGVLSPSVSSSAVTLQVASRPPPRPQRTIWPLAVAASALAALGIWALMPAPAPVAPNSASGAPLLRTAVAPPAASPELPVPAAAPSAGVEQQQEPSDASALPPPVAPSELPLSQATPEKAATSSQPAHPPKRRPLPPPAAPKRKVIDDGF